MPLLPFIFSFALFSSAFLSFSIQPILGKMMLPMIGGAPAGWIVAMAFFQLALLGGYGVSWALQRFNAWTHAIILILLYCAGSFYLPPILRKIASDYEGAALGFTVVQVLFQCIFVPFLALTATTAALQRVFAATKHPTAKDPYYLFVASNIGSFAGLLMYPFVLEPFSGLTGQSHLWRDIYILVITLIFIAVVTAWSYRAPIAKAKKVKLKKSKVTSHQIWKWLVLSFIPCSLSMGVTTLITTDIAGVPLFWIVPLGLYLLTFILAFGSKGISPEKLGKWHVGMIGLMVLIMALGWGFKPGGSLVVFLVFSSLLLTIFFVTALFCHRSLAVSRPSVEQLALFYFIVALGGGLAGILHAFILPFVLKDVCEFTAMALLSLLVNPQFRQPIKPIFVQAYPKVFRAAGVIAVFSILVVTLLQMKGAAFLIVAPFISLILMTFFTLVLYPRFLLALGFVLLVCNLVSHYPGQVIERDRNFFGSFVVYDGMGERGEMVRYFVHGNTRHGLLAPGKTMRERASTGYYASNNPIQDTLSVAHAKTIGIIGLGAGQIACYEKGLIIDYYEIDPDVERIAREHFPFLEKCPVRDVIIGDGRLMLDKAARHYDVFLLDAFTSDSVPVHLLTREAIQGYRKRLNKDGIMLFHVSNRYFDLTHPLGAVAKAEKLTAYTIVFEPDKKKQPYFARSRWVAIPLSAKAAKDLRDRHWQTVDSTDDAWTDDRSSLLSAFSLTLQDK